MRLNLIKKTPDHLVLDLYTGCPKKNSHVSKRVILGP